MSKINSYRLDIDGLRAVAVLAVLFFHLDVQGFRGGFIGVDIFFVISGFLIIHLIATQLHNNSFNLVDFWERRIRRIVPAMVTVLLVTTGAVYFILIVPSEFEDFGRTMMAQSVFLSNMWFMSLNDYFSAPKTVMPLLHTWTLAIEEQFYVLFPLGALLIYRHLKKQFGLVLILIALFSFAYCVYLTNYLPGDRFSFVALPHIWGSTTNESAGFYFIFSRLWEFLVGGIIAVYAWHIKNVVMAEVISLAGIGAIIYSILFFSENTAFPGFAALLPVAGTAAIIVANSSRVTTVRKILSIRTITWIGLLSYAIYLWHWPVIVLAKYNFVGDEALSSVDVLVILVIVGIVSALTYHYVEKPIRQKRFLPQQSHIYLAALISLITVGLVGYMIVNKQGFPKRISETAQHINAAMYDNNPRTDECFTKSTFGKTHTDEPCLLGLQHKEHVTFVLFGDSHANAVIPAFDEYGIHTNQTGVFFGAPNCPPLVAKQPLTENKTCAQEVEKALAYIKEQKPKEVFLVAEWTVGYSFVDTDTNTGFYLAKFLGDTIAHIPPGTNITIFDRLPTFPDYSFRDLLIEDVRNISHLKIQLDRKTLTERLQPHHEQIRLAAGNFTHVRILDPMDTLCEGDFCYMGDNGGLFYQDSSHLSVYGARKIILPLLLQSR